MKWKSILSLQKKINNLEEQVANLQEDLKNKGGPTGNSKQKVDLS